MSHNLIEREMVYERKDPASKGAAATGIALGAGGIGVAIPAAVMSIVALLREGKAEKAAALATTAGLTAAEVLAMINTHNASPTCNETIPLTRWDLTLFEQLTNERSKVATLEAEKYADKNTLELYRYTDGKISDVKDMIYANEKAQAAINTHQAVMNERNDGDIRTLAGQLKRTERRLDSIVEEVVPERRVCNTSQRIVIENTECDPVKVQTVK